MLRGSTLRLGVGSYHVFMKLMTGQLKGTEMPVSEKTGQKSAVMRSHMLGDKFWALPVEARAMLAAQGEKIQHKTWHRMKKKRNPKYHLRSTPSFAKFVSSEWKKLPASLRRNAPGALKVIAQKWHEQKHLIQTTRSSESGVMMTGKKSGAAAAAAAAAASATAAGASSTDPQILLSLQERLENILDTNSTSTATTTASATDDDALTAATKATQDALAAAAAEELPTEEDGDVERSEPSVPESAQEPEPSHQTEIKAEEDEDTSVMSADGNEDLTMSDEAARLLPLAAALSQTPEAKHFLQGQDAGGAAADDEVEGSTAEDGTAVEGTSEEEAELPKKKEQRKKRKTKSSIVAESEE